MEWGINIGENFVEVTAQNLPLPKLDFNGKSDEVILRYGRFGQ